MINYHTISSKRVTSENNYIPGLTRLQQRADRRCQEGIIKVSNQIGKEIEIARLFEYWLSFERTRHNDKPIKCTSCAWRGIEADLNNDLCPDCQSRVRHIYFGTIQDSLRALRAIGQEMMPKSDIT